MAQARGRLGLSIDELATKARISGARLRTLEHGEGQPRADVLGRIADALRCRHVDDLLHRVAP